MQVFGINDHETFSTALNFANNFGLTFPVLHDVDGTVYGLYSMSGISPYPRDVIIDQNGIIQYMSSEYDPQYMLQTVNDLLGISSVEEEKPSLVPEKFNLKVYPNPFNPVTNITFTVLESQPVHLQIVNTLGQVVHSKTFNDFSAGSNNSVQLNMSNYPSGLYFLNLTNGSKKASQKLILLQ